MRKNIKITILAAVMAFAMCFTAFAGEWKLNEDGQWWYDNGDGTYLHGVWAWIDGNGDGVQECYYFDADGFLLVDSPTPDGYWVNEDGAWVENGVVQTRNRAIKSVTPAALFNFDVTSKYNARECLWNSKRCYELKRSNNEAYVIFNLDSGDGYSTLTFKAYEIDYGLGDMSDTVSVYGDNNQLLWTSGVVNAENGVHEATVDIYGQNSVTISLGAGDTERGGWVYIYEAQLK